MPLWKNKALVLISLLIDACQKTTISIIDIIYFILITEIKVLLES